jgi:photosystem II stability/assembly factor-like uncharacterized protein
LAVAVGAVGLWAATALGNVSVGHSGWTWGSPQPQGNQLNALDFAAGRGYAAGTLGTLLRTDDNGQTWSGVATGVTQPLSRVEAISADSVVVSGGCALRRSDDGGQTFKRLPWTPSDQSCPSSLASFNFPSSSTGYLLTFDGSVFRTDDGGQSFSRRTSIPGTPSTGGNSSAADIAFTGADIGVAVAGNRIYRTTDGGNSWAQVFATGFPIINAVKFVDANVGYAVGDNSTVLRTPDGGQNWAPVPLTGAPPGLRLTGVDCSDAMTCLISESTGARILRTADGGSTATAISLSTQPILAAAFASALQVVAVGRGGATVVSSDGGLNFSPVGGRITGQSFEPVSASPAGIAVSGASNGVLARSDNGGQSWTTVGVPTPAQVLGGSFPSAQLGYALDTAGGVFKTTNGGTSWIVLNTGTTALPLGVVALDANTVLLVGPKGLRRSTDGGSSFASVTDTDVRKQPLQDVEQISGGSVFAFGPKVLALSTNSGRSWSRVKLPSHKFKLFDADMVSPKAAFVSSRDGRLYKTTNSGGKWTQLPAIGPSFTTRQISFSSKTDGMAQGDLVSNQIPGEPHGFVLSTTDGGKTWQPQLVSGSPVDVWDNGSVVFGNTTTGSFYSTKTRGQTGTKSKLAIKQVQKKSKKARISGTLSPAQGGEQVFVSSRAAHGTDWTTNVVTAASNGQFTTSFRVKKPSYVVAQWIGDGNRAGAGTAALLVKPPPKKPHH